MGKTRSLNVLFEQSNYEVENKVGEILREEHGAHGLQFIGKTAVAGELEREIHLKVMQDSEESMTFRYTDTDGSNITETVSENDDTSSIETVLSKFALKKLTIPFHEQTSRSDYEELYKYSGERPNLEADPSEWITGNPLIDDLCRRFPGYGNLIRYLGNERGLFLKVGNHPNQRAYWNSTLNGGLPAFKKSDPIHEGTFMLHDMFHFVPVDPLIGTKSLNMEHKGAYIAHRLLSEASTLVLADMAAVADARLEDMDYDISKRKIFPIYESIRKAQQQAPNIDKLLAANAYFCFTGDPVGFEVLGATREVLDNYKSKYESIFRDDFMWNMQNFDAMVSERQNNELMSEYYEWLENNTYFPTIHEYDEIINSKNDGLNIAKLLSLFKADFTNAFSYQKPMDDTKRIKIAYQKYLAGQRVVFARFGNQLESEEFKQKFDQAYMDLSKSDDGEEISRQGRAANLTIDNYLTKLGEKGLLLPHEIALYRFSAPLYPIKFVNYEKTKNFSTAQLNTNMKEFLHLNKRQLSRLLEAVES